MLFLCGRRMMRSMKLLFLLGILIIITILIVALWIGEHHHDKELPLGVSVAGHPYTVPSSDLHFFADRTYVDNEGVRHLDHEIFDEILRMVGEAESYILLDMFLYNNFLGTATSAPRMLTRELTDALIAKKTKNPEIVIQVITDPVNEFYNGVRSPHFTVLEKAGVSVITTDLRPLRDSNPLYSGLWRTLFQWFEPAHGSDLLPNPLESGGEGVGIASYLTGFNYKANHRKIVVTDYRRGDDVGISTLVTSFNPHDGSSGHSNSAVRVDREVWRDVVESERAVATFSGVSFVEPSRVPLPDTAVATSTAVVQMVTEEAIRDVLLSRIATLGTGDRLDMAMFYLADRQVIESLLEADAVGVAIRLLLDPSKDAFGRIKNGMPNRQVASELLAKSTGNIQIRWCDTHGEQCHSKLVLMHTDDEHMMMLGSANLTKRNIGGFNLETNIMIRESRQMKDVRRLSEGIPAIIDAQEFFEETWHNEGGRIYSTDYETYRDDSLFKKIRFRIKESTGANRW